MEKIAFITEDGKTISRHFGRATHYLVVTLEDGKETHRELRCKPGHQHFVGKHGSRQAPEHDSGEAHGFDPEAGSRHSQMASVIQDCAAVICGGMGWGAYEGISAANIRPIVTDLWEIDPAIQSYLDGTLQHRSDLLH